MATKNVEVAQEEQPKDINSPILEGLKELGRVVVLAILPVAIDSLLANEISWRGLVISLAVAALRAVDKWLHEKGKADVDENLTKGLTRF